MDYLSLKALHIIFIVTWFAGMFYIVRLFIYATEAQAQDEPTKSILTQQYKIMIKRLWLGITFPSAILTLIMGISLFINRDYWHSFSEQGWLQTKLVFLVGFYAYFFHLHYIFKKIQKNQFPYSPQFLRIWNEAATVFLIAIVFLAVVKNSLNAYLSVAILILIIILLFIAIKVYKKIREKKGA